MELGGVTLRSKTVAFFVQTLIISQHVVDKIVISCTHSPNTTTSLVCHVLFFSVVLEGVMFIEELITRSGYNIHLILNKISKQKKNSNSAHIHRILNV